MRRFLVQSILLHGIVLMLLFSWENPLAGKIALRNIIQVSLVEKGEDEPPPAKPEKAAGKPKEAKRIARLTPPSPVRPVETRQEVREEAPGTDSPRKEPAP